ncbi:MAG: TonB family protein [Gammaproteobacteria bacterium]|nr:TonB family protein [Gammaproteobacteria bacterium]MBV8405768.1 TonB family protein [Gammaproteobacteria bacterium]
MAALRLGLTPAPLIVLTRDVHLVVILKKVADAAHALLPVGSEVDLSSALMTHQAGVAVIDCAAVATHAGELIARLHAQFPELVLIVAGGSDEQSMLGAQITDGSVYRFLHRPLSEQRVRLFVEAAWRRHAEGAALPGPGTGALKPRRRPLAAWLLLAAVVVAAPFVWRVLHAPAEESTAAPAARAPSPNQDPDLESLLARADAALAAGALVAPAGDSAAELYREALQRNPRDPRAVNGLAQIIDRLLASAEAELQQQHLDAAQQLADQARAIDPNHARVAFLAAQIAAQRDRTALEARQQLVQKQLDARVAEALGHARDALARGALLAPPEDNARAYIDAARALAPQDAGVAQVRQDLITRLQEAARQAIGAKNAEQADALIAAAADAGADPAQVSALRAELQQLRSGVHAETVTQLAGSFSARLERGALLDPPNDSARFYLAQLAQQAPDDPATARARSAFNARLLDEARGALRAQDFTAARRWLTEARSAGADAAALASIETALSSAQDEAQQASSTVNAADLTRTHYVAPQFPDVARVRGIDGWVDLQFVVGTDGAVSDVTVVGAQPVGIFEQSALDALRHWRYQPVMHDGHAVNQHARVRLRFTVQR